MCVCLCSGFFIVSKSSENELFLFQYLQKYQCKPCMSVPLLWTSKATKTHHSSHMFAFFFVILFCPNIFSKSTKFLLRRLNVCLPLLWPLESFQSLNRVYIMSVRPFVSSFKRARGDVHGRSGFFLLKIGGLDKMSALSLPAASQNLQNIELQPYVWLSALFFGKIQKQLCRLHVCLLLCLFVQKMYTQRLHGQSCFFLLKT